MTRASVQPAVRLAAVLLLSTLARPVGAQPALRVATAEGTVEGIVDTASGVRVFRGIPYAAPPVGPLRWRPPQPARVWAGVRPARDLGRNCMQPKMYGDIDPFAAGVSEDCLYLNVWTDARPGERRPVMVWIHGGGFRAGFGGEARHDGGPLARAGAVVVTLNYRLGAFGFLAHPALAAEDPHRSAGNYGLLDQIAALQWVRRNVARFGGDPSRVTIFGESAGGMSVGALVASPLARGLFHRAVLESGTGIAVGVQPRDSAAASATRFAAFLGVAGTDAAAAAQLRAIGADSLLAALRAAETPLPGAPRGTRPPAPLATAPSVDGWVLPTTVDSAMARGLAARVPVIVGSNLDEPDFVFGAPARSFARLAARRGQPAWLYLFTRAGEDSVGRARGAFHSAEITFVFGRPQPLLPEAGRAPYDSTLAAAMRDYWVAFAATGDPNGPPARGRLPRWPAYVPATDAYLELGREIAPRQRLPRAAALDSLDAAGRARGEVRP